jgi:Predicted divalent heavy-metal cations transporter
MIKCWSQIASTQHMIHISLVACQIACVTAVVNPRLGSSAFSNPNHDGMSSYSRYMAENGTVIDDDDHDHDAEESKPWGAMIGFTLVVNLATLSGVVFLIPMISRNARKWVKSFFWNKAIPSPDSPNEAPVSEPPKTSEEDEHIGGNFIDISIPSFAGGALIATAVFLVIPESLYLIQSHLTADEEGDVHRLLRVLEEVTEEGHDDHEGEIIPDAIWRFGASLIGGFMLPMLLDVLFPRNKKHYDGDKCAEQEHFDEDIEHPKKDKVETSNKINYGLAASIILGDAFHNFCDGVFVGVALTLCDRITAYTIVAVTLYHEIAQELADYFL